MPKTETKLKPADFVHLHNHTHHSLLDGLQKVPEMVEQVRKFGMEGVAITDHGTLSGAIEFYKSAVDAEIKPIIGMETYIAARKHTDKDPAKDKSRKHLILLAMNNKGYENLMRLSSIANIDGYYYKPRLDKKLLEKYNEGLIVLSGCISSELGDALRNNDTQLAEETAKWYKQVFGDRYYIELADHGHMWDEQKKVNDKLIKLANKLNIPLIVTSDAHYLTHEDQEAHEVLLCIQTGAFLSDKNRMSLTETDIYLTDPKDIIKRWSHLPEAIQNTKKIADRVDINIELGKILIPKFETPKGKKEKYYLHELVYQGLAWRYKGIERDKALKLSTDEAKKGLSKEVLERTKFELDTIGSMGFESYFLIVQDFINWGKDRGIVFGPGRGSAAGSIVSYGLNITDLDPLENELLFERFLNPDRISMPDIDIDIQDTRRDEVIEYCVEKYGQDRVAHIVTFGTMAARNAIRDVARVLEVPYAEADRLAKMVPPPVQGRHIPLAESIKDNKDLQLEYDNNPQSKRVMDLAVRLEGTIRSHGVHAAGVVIAPDEIVKYTPIEMAQKGVITTQYPMYPIEELGLLKMDFLGLSNLTIVKNALRIIKKVHGKDIDIGSLPLDDKKTFELLGKGETIGVFQLESGGMQRHLKNLKPSKFDDIVAMNALYRPGPMQYIDDFIARKHGKKKIEYLHPKMKDALENTYGIIVYQEQVMQIAKDLCGLTGGQSDTLRKAIGKKIPELLAAQKEVFVQGGIKHSDASEELMEKLWQQLEDFAAYAFNKSHSACYGLIAYWTAYLKAHYPSAFMSALMTSDFNDTDRLAIDITECRHMEIDVLQPDINESFLEFGVVPKKKQIRFGLAAIKNVGTGAVESILEVRDADGPFKSVEDFAKRVNSRVVNRKVWESLIKSGAFDKFQSRNTLLLNLDNIIAYGSKTQKELDSGQTNLFTDTDSSVDMSDKLELNQATDEVSEREILQWERELLGLYLSKHPLDGFETYLEENATSIGELNNDYEGKVFTVGGVITTIREITTKNGAKMAFVGLEDKDGELELIAFPDAYAKNPEIWERDNIVIAKGKLNTKDRQGNITSELKILVDDISELSSEDAKSYKSTGKKFDLPKVEKKSKSTPEPVDELVTLYVHVKKPDDNGSLLKLKKLLNQHPGESEAVLVLGEKDKSAIRLPFKVDPSSKLTDEIASIYDDKSVVVK